MTKMKLLSRTDEIARINAQAIEKRQADLARRDKTANPNILSVDPTVAPDTASIRLPADVMAQVDDMAKGWGDTRSRALRRLIQVGLEHS